MPAFAELAESINSQIEMFRSKRNDLDFRLAKEFIQYRPGIAVQPRGEHHRSLRNSGSPHGQGRRCVQVPQQFLVTRFGQNYGDNCGGIQDQAALASDRATSLDTMWAIPENPFLVAPG